MARIVLLLSIASSTSLAWLAAPQISNRRQRVAWNTAAEMVPSDDQFSTRANTTNTTSFRRDMIGLQEWALSKGVLVGEHFQLVSHSSTTYDDSRNENVEVENWSVQARQWQSGENTTATDEGTRLLQVPSHLILSSQRIRDQLTQEERILLQPSIDFLNQSKTSSQLPQFYLVLKVLRQFELGTDSLWHPWIQSLPTPEDDFGTAISMDEVELDFLPPFAWSLAQIERLHCKDFLEAFRILRQSQNEKLEDDEEKRCLLSSDILLLSSSL